MIKIFIYLIPQRRAKIECIQKPKLCPINVQLIILEYKRIVQHGFCACRAVLKTVLRKIMKMLCLVFMSIYYFVQFQRYIEGNDIFY